MNKKEVLDHVNQVLEHAHKIVAEIESDEPSDDIIFGQAAHIEMHGRQIKRIAQDQYVNHLVTPTA